MKPLASILRFAFGCHHRQRSAVFTIRKRTYQVCLKCGQEFDYSWELMHSLRPSAAGGPDGPLPSKNATASAGPNEAPAIERVAERASGSWSA